MVPNRGAAAPWGAIYSAQGCRGLTRFFTISLKIHFQAVIKPQTKLLWVRHYGCRKVLSFSVGCRKPKKVGKHWSTLFRNDVHCVSGQRCTSPLSPLFTTLVASHRCAPPLPPITGRPDKSAVRLAPEASDTVPYG